MYGFLIYWFVSGVISALLTKVTNAKSADKDDVTLSEATEGNPITLFYGTQKLRGPAASWWGKFKAKAIKESTAGFFGIGSKDYTVGYRYYVSMQQCLCCDAIDELIDIQVGDKSINKNRKKHGLASIKTERTDLRPDSYSFNLGCPNLFGGDHKEGGIDGDVDLYFGTSTQPSNAYLTSIWGDTAPAYRGVCYAVLKNCYVGTSTYIKEWAWIVRRTPKNLSAQTANINGDSNPAEIIYDILTLPPHRGGRGISSARINTTSFNNCGTTLFNEGLGLSITFKDQRSADERIQTICDHVDAVVYEDPVTGMWTMALIRDDYTVSSLQVLDATNIKGEPVKKLSHWSDTANRIVVRYVSRIKDPNDDALKEFTIRTVQSRDTANRVIRGESETKQVDLFGFSNKTNAQWAAERIRRASSYPLAGVTLSCGKAGRGLRPGSVFKLNWPELGFDNMVMRVQRIKYGLLKQGGSHIEVEAIEDVFQTGANTIPNPPSSTWSSPVAFPVAVANAALIEAPYWMAGESRNVIAVAQRGDDTTEEINVWVREGGSDSTGTWTGTNALSSPTASGTLSAALAMTAYPTCSISILSPDDLASIITSDAASIADRDRGLRVCVIGNEWLAYGGITDNGDGSYVLNNCVRGIADTVPEDHAISDRIWFLSTGCAYTCATTSSGSSDSFGGSSINTSQLLPLGGTTGQALKKKSDASFDTEWGDVASGGGGGGAIVGSVCDITPLVPNPWDDEFNGSSLSGNWSSSISGSMVVNGGKLVIRNGSTAGSGAKIWKAIGGTPYKITTKVRLVGPGGATYLGAGIYIGDNSNGTPRESLILQGRSNGGGTVNNQYFNSDGSYSSETQFADSAEHELYLEVENNGTNRFWRVSSDGINFVTIKTEAYNNWITESYVGLVGGSSNTAGDPYMSVFEFIRKNWTATSAYALVNPSSVLAINADVPPAVPNALDDEFAFDSGPSGTGKWAWLNQGTATYGIENGALKISAPAVGGGDQYRCMLKTISGTTWSITSKVALHAKSEYGNYNSAGLILRNSSTGRCLSLALAYSDGPGKLFFNSGNAYAGVATIDSVDLHTFSVYLRLSCDGTTITASYSLNGESFTDMGSQALASWISSVDQVGVMTNSNNATNAVDGIFSWFRKDWTPNTVAMTGSDVYSYSETLTNKVWLGSLVYRKVVSLGTLTCDSSDHAVAHGISNLGVFTRAQVLVCQNGNYFYLGAIDHYAYTGSANINYHCPSNWPGTTTGWAILEYTKSS